MTPKALQTKLKKFSLPVLQKAVSKIITSDKEILQVKFEELQRGKRPDGAPIGEYSSSPMGQEYALFKNHKNPLPGLGQVDLIDTGAFAKGNKVVYLSNGWYTIESTDSKADELIEKYGRINEEINQDAWNRLQKNSYAPKLFRAIKI